MEGMGGTLCLYCDFLPDNSDEVKYPGYEILFWIFNFNINY